MTSSGAFLHHLREALKKAPACLVTVQQTEGSTPRERGAWMAVAADAVVGTIGGGHVEFQPLPRPAAGLRAGRARPCCAMRWAPAWGNAAVA